MIKKGKLQMVENYVSGLTFCTEKKQGWFCVIFVTSLAVSLYLIGSYTMDMPKSWKSKCSQFLQPHSEGVHSLVYSNGLILVSLESYHDISFV